MDRLTPEQIAAYEKVTDLANGNPLPWGSGPAPDGHRQEGRRAVGRQFLGLEPRPHQHQDERDHDRAVPRQGDAALPHPRRQQHNVWGNLWTNDQIVRYDPTAQKWTTFELPVRGTEIRHITIDERSGRDQGDRAGLPHQPDGRDDACAAKPTSRSPFPDAAMQPYHIHIDNSSNVWGNLWTNDQIVKYDPTVQTWTTFELPVRGTEIRHITIDERSGRTKIIVPVYRTNQMGVMTLRTDADIAALKAQAAK